MPLTRDLRAPGLLTLAQGATGMSQEAFGRELGVSRRTMIRWQQGGQGPSIEGWADIVRLVYPHDAALAARIAGEMEETLVSLGVVAPAPLAPAIAPHAIAPAKPPTSPRALADSIVCAAAEAVAMTPQALRPALVAAFDRAALVGLDVDEVRDALKVAAP